MSLHPPALVIVDVQDGLDDPQYGTRNNPQAEERIAGLLAAWRDRGWPVLYSIYESRRHTSPLRPGAAGTCIKEKVAPRPGEFVAAKSVNSVFKADGFLAEVRRLGLTNLVFVGLATDACISASAREARDLGFAAWVVADACATFDRRSVDGGPLPAALVHEVELGILSSAGVHIHSACDVLRHEFDGARVRS